MNLKIKKSGHLQNHSVNNARSDKNKLKKSKNKLFKKKINGKLYHYKSPI